MQIKGSHSHNKKSLDTTLSMSIGKKHTISASVFLKDKSKKLSSIAGGISMSLNQRSMTFSNVFIQQNKQKYRNDFSAVIGKTKASVISTAKVASTNEFDISNVISLPNMKTFTIAGQLNRGKRDFGVGVQLGKRLAMAFTSQYKPSTMIKVGGDIRVDKTRIIAEIEAEKNHPKYFGKVDFKWDADIDPSKRIQLVGEVINKDAKEVSATFDVTNPIQNINTHYNHVIGKETKSHFDVSVGGKSRFAFDLIHADDDSKKSGEIRIQTLSKDGLLKYNLVSSDRQYSNEIELSWGNSKKVALTVRLDKPFGRENINGAVTVITPFTGIKSSSIEINHTFNTKLESSLKMQLNKENVHLIVDLNNNNINDIKGSVSIKTSYHRLGSSSLTLTNQLSDNKFYNSITFDLNGEKFMYEGKGSHKFTRAGFKTNGKVILTAGRDTFRTKWDHIHSSGEITSKFTTNIGGKPFEIDLSGRQALTLKQGGISVSFKLKSPFNEEILLRVDHTHQPSLVDSSISASLGGKPLMSGKVVYNRKVGQVNFKTTLSSSGVSNEILVVSDYQKYPMTGQVNMKMNEKQIDISGSFDRQQNRQNGKIKVKTPFTKPIVIIAGGANDDEMLLSTSLQYGNEEILSVEKRHKWDNVKFLKISLSSSIQNINKIEGLFRLQNGNGMAYLEANTVKLSSEWNTVSGLSGKLRLDTPFSEIPYSQVTVNSKLTSGMTSSELNIEYLPRKNIVLKSRYIMRDSFSEGTLNIVTPFSGMRTMSGSFQLSNKKSEKRSALSYTCPMGTKYTADLSYTTDPVKKINLDLAKDSQKVHADAALDMTSGYPQGSLKVSSPFADDIVMVAKQSNIDGVIVTLVSMDYSTGRKISVENKFRVDDHFVFTTSIATPYETMKTINSVLEAKGDRRSFSFIGSVEAEPTTKKLLASGAFNMYGSIDGNLRIETPFESLPYSQVTISSQRKGELTTTLANIEYMPSKFITGKATHQMNINNIEVSLEIKTPFRALRHASASLEHKVDETTGLISSLGIEYPKGKHYSVDFAFNKNKKTEGFATLTSPFHYPVSLSFFNQGKYPSFETHAELKYKGNQKHVFDFALNNKAKNFKAAISYKCPNLDKISFEATHQGDFKQFSTEMRTQFKKGEPHEAKVIFKNLAKMQGSLIIKSAYIKDFKASFHHTGSLKNLKTHAEYVYGKMKPNSADIALITGKSTKASLKLASPFFDDMTLNIVHKGQLKSFRNRINLIFSKKEKISTDLNFRLAKVMKATLIFVSPFKGFKKVVANVKHEGNWKNFKCDASVKRGKDMIKANMKTSLGSKIMWASSLETPFAGWKKMNAEISHEGTLTNFQSHAEFSRGKQYVIAGDVNVVVNPSIDILVAAQTPYAGYKNVKASLQHDVSSKKIKTNAEITYFKKDTISVDFLVDRQTRSTDITVMTPFKNYERVTGSFSHSGHLTAFNTKLNIASNKDKYIAELNFDSVNQLSAETKISIPSKVYPVTEVSFTYSGSINNFHSRTNLLFNKKKSFADLKFNTISGVEGKFTFMTPYFDTVKANVHHNDGGKMKTSINIDYGKKSIFSFDSLIGRKGSPFGTMSLKAGNLPKIQGTYEYDGGMLNNKALVQIFYGKKKLSLETQMESKSDIKGNIIMLTPFKDAETIYLTYSKSGSKRKLNGQIEAGINQQKIEANLLFSVSDMAKASFTIKTPFSYLKSGDISTRIAGTPNNFDSHAEISVNGKVAEADLTSTFADRVDIRATVKSPYTKDLLLKLNHDGTKNNFKSVVETGYGNNKITGQVTTDLTNGIQIDAVIKTPFTEDIIFATSNNDDFGDFRSLSQLTYNGAKQHEMEVTFSTIGDFKSLKSSAQAVYNGKRVSGKLDFDGEINNFRSYAEAIIINKKNSIKVIFDGTNNIDGQLELKTPYTQDFSALIKHSGRVKNFHSMSRLTYGKRSFELKGSFSHEGTLTNFNTYAEIGLNGQQASIDVSFKATDSIEGKAALKTPITDSIIVHFSNEGELKNFKSCLKITYSGKLQHEANLKFNHYGSLTKFNTDTSLTYNNKMTSVEITFDTSELIEGKLTVKTPVSDDVIIHFSHEGKLRNFKSCLKITYSGELQHDASLKFNHDGGLAKFNTHTYLTYNSKMTSAEITFDISEFIEGKVTVKTPVSDDVIIHFSHEGKLRNFKSCLKMTYSGKLQHDASLKFNHDGVLAKFNTETSLTYNNKVTSAVVAFDTSEFIEGKLTVKTPFSEDVIIHFSHEGKLNNFKSCLKITYSGKLQHDASFTFKAVGIMSKFTGETSLMYNKKNAAVTAVFDSTSDLIEGKLTTKTSFTDDIIIAFSTEGNLKHSKTCLKVTYGGKLQHDTSFQFGFDGSLKKLSTMGSLEYNKQRGSFSLSFNSKDKLTVQFRLKTPFYDDVVVSGNLANNHLSLKSDIKISYGGSLKYDATIDFKTRGSIRKFKTEINVNYNDKSCSANFAFNTKSTVSGKLDIKSSWTKNLRASLTTEGTPKAFTSNIAASYGSIKHTGHVSLNMMKNSDSFKSIVEVSFNGQTVSGDLSVDFVSGFSSNLEIKTPWTNDVTCNIQYRGQPTAFTTNVQINYGRKNYNIGSKFNLITTGSRFGIETESSYNDKKATLAAVLSFDNKYTAKLSLTTPYTKDLEVTSSFQLTKNKLGASILVNVDGSSLHNCKILIVRKFADFQNSLNLNVDYNGQAMSGDFSVVSYDMIDAKMSIDTPFQGYKDVSANMQYDTRGKTTSLQINGRIGSKNFEISSSFDKSLPFNGKVNVKTPFSGISDMSFNINFNDNPTNFLLTSDVQIESQTIYDLTFEHVGSMGVIQGNLDLKTAVVEDINIKYDTSGSFQKFTSSFSASIGSENYFTSTTNFDISTRNQAKATSSVDISVAGTVKRAEMEISGARSFNDMSVMVKTKLDNNEIRLESTFKVQPSFEAMIKIQTPFRSIRSMVASVKYAIKANTISNSVVFSLSPEKVYEISVNVFNKRYNKADIKAEVKTPIKGHELMRFIYRHNIDTTATVFTSYECSTGIQLVGDFKLTSKSLSMELNTPFKIARRFSAKGFLESRNNIYNLETSAKLNNQALSFKTLIDVDSSPMTARVTVLTPFNGFESSDVRMSCSGDRHDLRVTFELTTPLFKPVNSEIHLRYASILDMETTAILTTGFKHLERVSASLVNQKTGREYKSHVETSWNKDNKISLDATCDVTNGIKNSLVISTPFKSLKMAKIDIGHKNSDDNKMVSIFLEHNAKHLIDLDAVYTKAEHHTVSIITRHPRPMNFRIGGNMEAGKMNTDISLNWNTDKTDSSIDMETYLNHNDDKCSIALRLTHPKKSFGFRGQLEKNNKKDFATFDVSVGNKDVFGYTFDCKHTEDERASSIKLRFPSRSVMVSNEVQKRLGSTMATTAFYWDADRDQTKKVTVKGEINPSDEGVEANVILEMPSIGQVYERII